MNTTHTKRKGGETIASSSRSRPRFGRVCFDPLPGGHRRHCHLVAPGSTGCQHVQQSHERARGDVIWKKLDLHEWALSVIGAHANIDPSADLSIICFLRGLRRLLRSLFSFGSPLVDMACALVTRRRVLTWLIRQLLSLA